MRCYLKFICSKQTDGLCRREKLEERGHGCFTRFDRSRRPLDEFLVHHFTWRILSNFMQTLRSLQDEHFPYRKFWPRNRSSHPRWTHQSVKKWMKGTKHQQSPKIIQRIWIYGKHRKLTKWLGLPSRRCYWNLEVPLRPSGTKFILC